jgi:hypothetical protein
MARLTRSPSQARHHQAGPRQRPAGDRGGHSGGAGECHPDL